MKALAPTMQKFLVLFKVFFSKVGQTSRSTSWGQQFYYPMKGLVTIKVSHTPKIKNFKFWYPKNGLFTCYQVKIQIWKP